MPTVPSAAGPSVRPSVTPDVRTQPAPNVLGAVEAGLTRAAGAFGEIEQDELRKARRASLTKAQTALAGVETELLWDKDKGAYSTKGDGAFDLPTRVLPEWQKRAEVVRGTVTDPEVQAALDTWIADRSVDIERGLNKHEAGERESFYSAQAASGIATMGEQASKNWQDPTQTAKFLSMQEHLIRDEGGRQGLPQDAIDLAILKAGSAARRDVATQMIDGKLYKQAESFLKANKNSLLSDDQDALEEMVKVGKRQDEAEARQRVAWARQDAAYYRDRLYDQAAQLVDQRKPVPPSLLSKLEAPQLSAIRSMQAGEKVVTDWMKYDEATALARKDPKKFLDKGMSEFAPYLATPEMAKLATLRDSLRKGEAIKPEQRSSILGVSAATNKTLRSLFYPDTEIAQGSAEYDDINTMLLEADRLVTERSERENRKLTPQEMKETVDEYAVSEWARRNPIVRVTGKWWDSPYNVNSITDEQLAKAYVDVDDTPPLELIPATTRDELTDIASEFGVSLTDEQMREVFGVYALLGMDAVRTYVKSKADAR